MEPDGPKEHITLPMSVSFETSFHQKPATILIKAFIALSMKEPTENPAPSGGNDAFEKMRAAWASIAPEWKDYAAVVSEIHPANVMGDASCLSRGPHVSITHMEYLKPTNEVFVTELRAKDRHSAKK